MVLNSITATLVFVIVGQIKSSYGMHVFYNTFFSIYMLRVKEENYYKTNDLFALLFSLTRSGFLNHFYKRLYCFQSDILT